MGKFVFFWYKEYNRFQFKISDYGTPVNPNKESQGICKANCFIFLPQ